MIWLPKKPNIEIFFPTSRFRVNPDPNRRVSQLTMTLDNGQWWLIHEDAEAVLENHIDRLCQGDLCEAQLSDGSTFFLPVIGEVGSEAGFRLFDFMLHTAQRAKTEWVTIEADSSPSSFRVVPQQQCWPEPLFWPERDFVETVKSAFAGRYIAADHLERQQSFHEFLTDACDHGDDPAPLARTVQPLRYPLPAAAV